jgi:hypothetical protein
MEKQIRENLDDELDPHRAELVAAANMEVAGRLGNRGIAVTGRERSEELADLLSAVERFEGVVEARGGDLMVDDLTSSEPDDPHFVLPARGKGETLRDYIDRIDAAATRLARHREHK